MAAIGQIRKHSGLIIVVVGIALAAFVLGDFMKPSSSRPRQIVGSVDGEDIATQNFENDVTERIEATKNQRQTDKLSPQDIFQIRQAVWNEMVDVLLLNVEYEKIGLTITSDELSDQILGDQPHQYVTQSFTNPNTNTFDPEMLRNFLQNLDNADPGMRKRYLNLESLVKSERLKTKYKNLISKGYFVSDQFAKLDFEFKNSTADIRYAAARFNSVADSSVNVTDADLENYYQENIYKYSQEETRSIDYVIFDVKASSEDRKQIANLVNGLYKELKDIDDVAPFVNSTSDDKYDSTYKKEAQLPARIAKEMFESPIGTIVGPYVESEKYYVSKLMNRDQRPDSLNLSQLLITYKTAPAAAGISERSIEDAQALVDSLFAAVEKNTANFESIVAEFSDFPSAAEDKGEMGWVMDGVPGYGVYYDNGYQMEAGDVKVMETALGFHILKLNEKTEAIEKVRVATVTRAIEPSNATFQEKYLEASIFAGTNNTKEKFDTAVVNQGLNKRSADRLAMMANRLAGLENARQIIRWAYSETNSIGKVSHVIQDEDKYIVATLKSVTEKGTAPFEEVKEQIRPLVTNLMKADILEAQINAYGTTDLYAIAAKLGQSVDTATISFNSRNIPGFGSEYGLIGEVFTLEPGVSSGPVKGNNAVFVVIADDIKQTEAPADLAANAGVVERKFTSQFMGNSYINALKENAEIYDNRLTIY